MNRTPEKGIVIFIAHAHADRALANALKNELKRVFGRGCEVFCSSSPENMRPGTEWLTEIERPLRTTQALVALVTPASVGRPWLWFEVGAAWLRIPEACRIYPLCAPSINLGDLPEPLKRLNSISIDEPGNLKKVIDELVAQLGVGNAAAFRVSNVSRVIPKSWNDESEAAPLGYSPLHYAWRIIHGHRPFVMALEDGEPVGPDIRFEVFTQLVFGVLDTERPEGGFSSEYVYMRVWKAWQQISDADLFFHPRDFEAGMEVLRLIGVLSAGEFGFWSVTGLGWHVYKKRPFKYADEALNQILETSDELEFPTLEEADEFLLRGAIGNRPGR